MSSPPPFAERLRRAIVESGSLLCVGLDPDAATCPDAATAERFCRSLIEETAEVACAYKPNVAFFEQHGAAGWAVLERVCRNIPQGRLLVVDAKRGDVAATAAAYARALFDVLGADAVTVNPLLGHDSVVPFLGRPGRGAFLVARSSNPGAADFLEQPLAHGRALYLAIAELAREWDPGGTVGLVVGATAPAAVAAVRRIAPGVPLLLPGVGPQGGDLVSAVAAGMDADGGGLLVAVSRGVAAAPEGPRLAARRLAERLGRARIAALAGSPAPGSAPP